MDIPRKLPTSIQNFESLRKDGYLYVDKTGYLYKLVHTGRQYFLSRPRRFGKSLFLSTLRAYWEGKKELFSGLQITELEKSNPEAWQPHPVFYFDLNRGEYRAENSLAEILDAHLKEWEKLYGCEDTGSSLPLRFQSVLVHAAKQTGRRCIVLVDEYDKPLLETIRDPELQESNRALFKGFFSALKNFDEYLRFVLIAGITKFSKVSIFSDLNQLEDISMDRDYADLCGITENELIENFSPEIQWMASEQKMPLEACLRKLKDTYDGYRFHQDSAGVYNPYSLLSALKKREFDSYWFESGTPSFLVKKLKETSFDVKKFSDQTLYAGKQEISDYRDGNPNPIPLLYQTGYLTIRDYDARRQRYTLGFPNEEVKYGLLNSLLPEYVPESSSQSGKDIFSLEDCVEKGDIDGLMTALTALFAGIPYSGTNNPFEHYFQTIIYIVFTLLGKYTQCEVHSGKGRADCIVQTTKFVYIMEFKLDKSADEALSQIEEKGYALPYAADPRTIFKIGICCDSKTRNLSDWKVVTDERI